LFDDEILEMLQKCYNWHHKIKTEEETSKLAHKIARRAYKKSKIKGHLITPFNNKLEECTQIQCDSGKEDDITVIVGVVTS